MVGGPEPTEFEPLAESVSKAKALCAEIASILRGLQGMVGLLARTDAAQAETEVIVMPCLDNDSATSGLNGVCFFFFQISGHFIERLLWCCCSAVIWTAQICGRLVCAALATRPCPAPLPPPWRRLRLLIGTPPRETTFRRHDPSMK